MRATFSFSTREVLGGASARWVVVQWPRGGELEPTGTQRPRSRRLPGQIADTDEVVRGQREGEHPVHAPYPAMPRLAHQPHRLEPAEDLFHPLAPLLTDRVPRVPGGAAIDGAAPLRRVLRHVGGDAQHPDGVNEV